MPPRNKPLNNSVVTLGDINGDEREQVPVGDYRIDPGLAGEEETPGEIALNDILGELGDDDNDAKVYAYLIDPKTNKNVYLKTYSVQEYKAMNGLDGLRDEWGGGTFHLRVMQGRALLTRRNVPIADLPKRNVESQSIDIATILAQQQAMMMQGFRELAQSMAPKQESMGIKDVLEIMTAMRPMMDTSHVPAAPVDPFAMMKMSMEFAKEFRGSSGGESSDIDLIGKALDTFGKPIAEALAASNAAKASAPVARLANPAPRIIPDQQSQPAPQPNEDNEMGLMFNAYKKVVINAAASNADPVTYAELVFDNFTVEQLDEFIVKPTWFEEIKTAMPEAANYQIWFAELRELIMKMLQDEKNSARVPENSPSGTGNATG